MQINTSVKKIKIKKKNAYKTAIIQFEISDYILYVFQGDLSNYDILIKYSKSGKRIRTPKHVHWAVDVLIKMQGNENLTKKYLKEIQSSWNSCSPLLNNDFNTIKDLIESKENDIDLMEFSELSQYGEYNIEFLYVLMELLAIQEKTNREDAYMFGKVITKLLQPNRDIFSIISAAGYGGRKG